jgi:hypothetical protein
MVSARPSNRQTPPSDGVCFWYCARQGALRENTLDLHLNWGRLIFEGDDDVVVWPAGLLRIAIMRARW